MIYTKDRILSREGKQNMNKLLHLGLCFLLIFAFCVPAIAENTTEYTQLESGSRGSEVEALQERLQELGFYTISVDGIYGNGTVGAIESFEEFNGLPVTGVASVEVQELLFSDDAKGIPVALVEIRNVGMRDSYGSYYARPTFLNNTEDTIDAVTCMIRWYNAYGQRMGIEPLTIYNAQFGDYTEGTGWYYQNSMVDISNLNIAPGESYATGSSQEIYMESIVEHNSIAKVLMAVVRYHTTDGRTVVIPENEQVWKGNDGTVAVFEYPNNLTELPEMTDEMQTKSESFMLGIDSIPVSNFFADAFGMPVGGVYIHYVEKGSIAEDAGIRQGDIVVRIGDIWITDWDSLDVAKALMDEDGPTEVIYYRNGEECTTEMFIQLL